MSLSEPRNVALMQNIIGITHTSLFTLPLLRGLWAMSNADETPAIYDLTGQGRTLSDPGIGGQPDFGVDEFMGYADYNGSNDIMARADEAGLSITGELSMFIISQFDAAASAQESVMAKWFTGSGKSYILYRDASGNIISGVSGDGSTDTLATSTTVVTADAPVYMGLSFNPSTSLKVYTGFLGGTNGALEVVENTTSIPASIFDSTGFLIFGANQNGGASVTNQFDGRQYVGALAASKWDDNIHNLIWKQLSPLLRIGV